MRPGPVNYFKEVRTGPYYLDERRYTPPDDGFYLTDALTDHAVGMMEEAADQDQPFFLYAAYLAPHWPLHAEERDIDRYRAIYRNAGWDELRRRRHRKQIEMGLIDAKWPLTPRDDRAVAWREAPNKAWEAELMAVYAAQVERLDRNVGRILSTLKLIGEEENTVVMFLSDNGASSATFETWPFSPPPNQWTVDGKPVRAGHRPSIMPGPADTFVGYGPSWANLSNTPFRREKRTAYEGGIATPFIVRWPGVIENDGRITQEVAHVMDLMPTCLELAGIGYPAEFAGRPLLPLEGKSLVSVLRGNQRTGHKALFWDFMGNRAVRSGPWKLVALNDQAWELFDMESDRTELTNLVEEHPERARRMSAMFNQWSERMRLKTSQ